MGIEGSEAAEEGPGRGDVDDQLGPDLIVARGEYLLRDGPSLALGEPDVVDAQVGLPRQPHRKEVPGCPHSHPGVPGDGRQNRVDLLCRRQLLGDGFQRLEPGGQQCHLVPEEGQLVLHVGRGRHGGGRVPSDLEHAAIRIEGLALRFVDARRSHAEQNRELRQCARRVITEQPISDDRSGRGHADRTVVVTDVDDLGSGDRGLLGLDGGIDPQDLGGRPERPEQRDDLRAGVPADDLHARLSTHVRVVEDPCRRGEERQPFRIGAPAVRILELAGRPLLSGFPTGPARPPARLRPLSHGRGEPRAWSSRAPEVVDLAPPSTYRQVTPVS